MPERRRPLKIAEVTSVDYSLRNFLLPLMRGMRERGHEVVGVCADGPLLDVPRAEGFRIVPVPMARSLDPRAQFRAFRALGEVFRAERFDLVHAHNPISGLLGRAAARPALRLGPAGGAGSGGPGCIEASEAGRHYLPRLGGDLRPSHLLWCTGGSLVPDAEHAANLARGGRGDASGHEAMETPA